MFTTDEEKSEHYGQCKGCLQAQERIEELQTALFDCLNDYINFDDGYLTESVFKRASKLLNKEN
jgi:hypothetical protein